MYSANLFKIRDADLADIPELVRLGWATQEDWPEGRILVGEIRGVVRRCAGDRREPHRARRRARRAAPPRAHARARGRDHGVPSARRRSPSGSVSGCARA